MAFVVAKLTASYTIVLMLFGCFQPTEAESFMDMWLSQQAAKPQDDWLSQQLSSELQAQLPSSSSFDKDEWLSRQKASKESASAWPADSGSIDGQEVAFSQEAWAPAASWEADQDLEHSLLSELEKSLGHEHRQMMEGRIVTIEERMHPMFQALPKNEYGKLGHSSVRYMLHRFFVEQHGWSIDGLFTEGAALNTSSPAHTLKDRVPMFVQGLFEKRLGGRGFGVHEIAVLAAVVEDSVHQEAQSELKKTYKALGLPLDTNFDKAQLELVIDVYMSGYLMSTNLSHVSADELYRQTAQMDVAYPTWESAQKFFRGVRQNKAGGIEVFSLVEVSEIVRELVDTFGTFHGDQCQGLKKSLKDLEATSKRSSSGCVSLPDFYKKGLKGDSKWLFIESPEYLRQTGLLDETDPQNPRLLSANYMNSPGNCLQPSGYYMVCCHNECDDIFGKLEKQLGKPSATPAEITAALRTVPNFNEASLRAGQLSPALRRRLQDVADNHNGFVPIHGRLFAQWLHHVYPHECPYPHVSGSKHPQWVEDFEKETGKVSQLTDEEMKSFVLTASKLSASSSNMALLADSGSSCAPWQNEEELFAFMPQTLPLRELENDPHLWQFTGGIAFVAAAATFMITLSQTCKSVTKMRRQHKMLQL